MTFSTAASALLSTPAEANPQFYVFFMQQAGYRLKTDTMLIKGADLPISAKLTF
jgi:hypothetical protein